VSFDPRRFDVELHASVYQGFQVAHRSILSSMLKRRFRAFILTSFPQPASRRGASRWALKEG
jgi:hypothetical protein